jgi:type VI secretion system protein ImpH
MATQDRRQAPDIKNDLLNNSRRFSFIQAMRLLRYVIQKDNKNTDVISRSIRVRPRLSLDFPTTDIDTIEDLSQDSPLFLLTVTFLGLYGVSSPLPSFYTEDLMDEESQDIAVTRDFLDIINAPFYRLFYQCWSKYRQYIKIIDEQDPQYFERLFCFLGLGIEKHRQEIAYSPFMIPYIGLFTQFPRSALGLQTLLSDILNEPKLEIEQCIPRKAKIPEDQRLLIGVSGNVIGLNSYLGEQIYDRMGAFRIKIGPVRADAFQEFLPDTRKTHIMGQLIRLYLDKPLRWECEMTLNAEEVKTVCLGDERWSRLGWDTWIFSDNTCPGDAGVTFYEPAATG